MASPLEQFSFSLELTFNSDTNEVSATLAPAYNTPQLTREIIEAELQKLGYSSFFVHKEKLEELLALDDVFRKQGQKLLTLAKEKLATENPEANQTDGSEISKGPTPEDVFALTNKEMPILVIAERKDAEIEITTSEDEIIAYISIHPPCGGNNASEDQIMAAIQKFGISAQLNQETIDHCISQNVAENLVLAKGVKPKKGKDSVFEPLVETDIYKGPSIDEKGRADYHDLYEYVVVEPGAELMRRAAPGDGKSGMDVFGKPITAEQGELLPFAPDLAGAIVSPENPDVIVATEKGRPIFQERGASVDNVLTVKNASLATGNISFDGSVCVEEDVADGITIEASGDVTVMGTVGKAHIQAGNNISIGQGLIGGTGSKQEDDEADSEPYGAFLKANGSISVKFASYAKLEAGNQISLQEYATHCGLFAENKILVGKDMGTGSLIGGEARAFETIFAKTVGSTGGAQTSLRIGAEADTLVKLRTANQQINANNRTISDNAEQLNKLAVWAKVAGINDRTREKIDDLNNDNKERLQENLELEQEADQYKKLLMRTKRSRVIVSRKLFHNVDIAILSYHYKVKEETNGGKFRFDARQIILDK